MTQHPKTGIFETNGLKTLHPELHTNKDIIRTGFFQFGQTIRKAGLELKRHPRENSVVENA